MKIPRPLVLFSTLAFVLMSVPAPAAERSRLWGEAGELWSARSRLPDFSFAGYRAGEREIPAPAVTANVRDFGAKGDGSADDTAAFNAAIAATEHGAILVPAGRYKISGFVDVNKSGLVLRGEGPERSVLCFERSLTDVEPNWGATTTGKRTSNYSWSGGFVRIIGAKPAAKRLATVTPPFAARGDEWLPVSATEAFEAGRWISIRLAEDEARSLARWLYNDDSGSISAWKPRGAAQVARVLEVDAAGRRIRLDRALRYDLRAEWKPVAESFEPTVTESGVERLGFEFPATPYAGHFTEPGFNALDIRNAAHCWIRDVRIVNSDSGIFANGAHCTLDGVVLESAREPAKGGTTGHHGITVNGADNLVTRFDFRQRFVHDISVEGTGSAGNVFSEGRGVDLCFDHHKRGPHANLFTNIDCGAGKRVWACGGGADLGKNSAGWETFWGLRSVAALPYPPDNFGPRSLNLVGIKARDPGETSPEGKWREAIAPEELAPANLHLAQRARRLGAEARR